MNKSKYILLYPSEEYKNIEKVNLDINSRQKHKRKKEYWY